MEAAETPVYREGSPCGAARCEPFETMDENALRPIASRPRRTTLTDCERREAETRQSAAGRPAKRGCGTSTRAALRRDQQLYAGSNAPASRCGGSRNAELIVEKRRGRRRQPGEVVLLADAGALWRARRGAAAAGALGGAGTAHPSPPARDDGRWFGFSRRERVIARKADSPRRRSLVPPRRRPRSQEVCVRSYENV